jgi:catechol 2,3-dioxygenase-like lactoylglutathione lyase family enzyme
MPLACGILDSFGAWRSLVARTVRVGEVPGSNPGAPTQKTPQMRGFLLTHHLRSEQRLAVIAQSPGGQPPASEKPARRRCEPNGFLNRAVEGDRMRVRSDTGSRPGREPGVRPNQWGCRMAGLPLPPEGLVLTRFIVSDDLERSKRFYTEVLGGRVALSGKPSGEPTTSRYPTAGSSSTSGAARRTTSLRSPWRRHQYEIRCYIRDPDGHIIEVGQTTDPEGDWTPAHWPSGQTS